MAIKRLPKRYSTDFKYPKKKPVGAVELDFSNSLANGLHSSFIFSESAGLRLENLVNNSKSGEFLGINEVIRQVSSNGNRSLLTDSLPDSIVRLDPSPFIDVNDSFAWVCRLKFISGNQTGIIFGNRSGGVSSPLQFMKLTPSRLEYYNATSPRNIFNSLVQNQWVTVVLNKNGNQIEYFVDAESRGSVTVATSMGINPIGLGGDTTNNDERTAGEFEFFHSYNRALTGAEIQRFSSNPYQLVKPKNAPVYFSPQAPSGGVTANGAFTIPQLTITGSATATLPQPIADGAFTIPQFTITGSASAALPQPIADGAFTIPQFTITGSATATLPQPIADGAFTIPQFTIAGSATATLPQPIADGAFTIPQFTITGSASVTLPQPIADGAFTIPQFTIAGSASATVTGNVATGAFTIPQFTIAGSASATQPQPIANGAFTIPQFTIAGSASATLPQPIANGAFTIPHFTIAGSASALLPQPIINGILVFPTMTISGSASVTLPQPVATGAFTIPLFTINGFATVSGLEVIVNSDTNIDQIFLSSNIDQIFLSNNINYK
jgi:hypothetical protein